MPSKKTVVFALVIASIAWSGSTLRSRAADTPSLDVWVLSVGQGESVLLREAGGHTILFDGGPDNTVLSEIPETLPYWDRRIDLVVLSHTHSDHLFGLIRILERYDVGEVRSSGAEQKSSDFEAWKETLAKHSLVPRTVSAGFTASLGTLSLRVYHPVQPMAGETPKNPHDATVVLKASYGQESVLLTGDLDEQHEREIIAACPPPNCSLASSVLQVPHHGSKTGLSKEFLTAVSPQLAFVPVGIGNTYGHPNPDVLNRLSLAGVPYYRTDSDGRIRATLTEKTLRHERVAHSPPR